MPLRETLRFVSRNPFVDMMDEGLRIGEARRIPGVREVATPYKAAFMREGETVVAPAPIVSGGREGSEAQFLLGSMVRQAEDVGVPTQRLRTAWEDIAAKGGSHLSSSSGEHRLVRARPMIGFSWLVMDHFE